MWHVKTQGNTWNSMCHEKVLVCEISPSAVRQLHPGQQEVLVILGREHLLLLPLLLGHDLLHLGLLTESGRQEHQLILSSNTSPHLLYDSLFSLVPICE